MKIHFARGFIGVLQIVFVLFTPSYSQFYGHDCPRYDVSRDPTQVSYRGNRNFDANNVRCLSWAEAEREGQPYGPRAFPHDGLERNACRNPQNSSTSVWCYIKERGLGIRKSACNICRDCLLEGADYNPAWQSFSDTIKFDMELCYFFVTHSAVCYEPDRPFYGDLRRSKSGKTCLKWKFHETHLTNTQRLAYHMVSNLCRKSPDRPHPYCWVQNGANSTREDCDIVKCSEVQTKKPQFYYARPNGHGFNEYQGVFAYPECAPWDKTRTDMLHNPFGVKFNGHSTSQRRYDQRSGKFENNFCRVFIQDQWQRLWEGKAWCYGRLPNGTASSQRVVCDVPVKDLSWWAQFDPRPTTTNSTSTSTSTSILTSTSTSTIATETTFTTTTTTSMNTTTSTSAVPSDTTYANTSAIPPVIDFHLIGTGEWTVIPLVITIGIMMIILIVVILIVRKCRQEDKRFFMDEMIVNTEDAIGAPSPLITKEELAQLQTLTPTSRRIYKKTVPSTPSSPSSSFSPSSSTSSQRHAVHDSLSPDSTYYISPDSTTDSLKEKGKGRHHDWDYDFF